MSANAEMNARIFGAAGRSRVRVFSQTPENQLMNERIRGTTPSSGGADKSDATPPALEGLEGGARTVEGAEESTSDVMNARIRVAAGRQPPPIRLAVKGVPLRD